MRRPRLAADDGWLEGGALFAHFGKHLSLGGRAQHENRRARWRPSYDGFAYGFAGEVRL